MPTITAGDTVAEIGRRFAAERAAQCAGFTAADVTVTRDRFGRDVLVIPDGVARRLAESVRNGWREVADMATGYSRAFGPDTWEHAAAAAIITAYAASECDPADWQGLRDRKHAADWGQMPPVFIVGASGWDADVSWWAADCASDVHKAVSVPGTPSRKPSRPDHIEFTG
jgi:hypothetical protein